MAQGHIFYKGVIMKKKLSLPVILDCITLTCAFLVFVGLCLTFTKYSFAVATGPAEFVAEVIDYNHKTITIKTNKGAPLKQIIVPRSALYCVPSIGQRMLFKLPLEEFNKAVKNERKKNEKQQR